MPKITVRAPAKLNLHLQIGGRRPDGFHELESLFLALAFGDTLHVETAPQPLSLEICMNWQVKGDLAENIITRAVSLFTGRTGWDTGLKITVEKRIPLGGGLGGGSSDAAAALLALNRLAAPPPFAGPPEGGGLLSNAELAKIGESLGSDVPFFLCNASAAWVSGRGEKIQPLKLPEPAQNLSLVLVNPGFPSDTAEAYRLLDLYRETYTHINFSQRRQGAPNLRFAEGESFANRSRSFAFWRPGGNSLEDKFWPTSPQDWPFFNDFMPVFQAGDEKFRLSSKVGTIYQHIISCLKEQGAGFAGLSGSGSTCFGVFSDRARAELAKDFHLKHWPFVINTFLLACRPTL